MKYDREEMSKDYNERLERVTAEKEVTEQKYETKRRALKESEAQYARLKNQYDREKAVIDEKYHYLESGREELIKNYET
jgi:predicted  nucleic acid-binding Zn-ribbon protein